MAPARSVQILMDLKDKNGQGSAMVIIVYLSRSANNAFLGVNSPSASVVTVVRNHSQMYACAAFT